jgi:autotransporter translocation and assembly factor TamB
MDLRSTSFADVNSMSGTLSVTAPRVSFGGYRAEQLKADARIAGRRIAINGRASAYGAVATTAGEVTLPAGKNETIVFDLHGLAQHVDLRQLPQGLNIPPAKTNVNAEYHVAGTPASLQGDARFDQSTVAGATIAGGSMVGFSRNGENLGYTADVTVADLDLQRAGEQFRVPALAADRYKSSINGRLIAHGSGKTPEDIDVTASGTLSDTSVLGGRIPQLSFDGSLAHDNAHIKATGDFAGFDPAVASGRPAMKGTIGGTLDLDATVSGVSHGVTPESVQASGKVDLQPSTIGGLEISRASVDADYHDSTGEIRTLEIVGRDVNVSASGTLALNDSGASNLKLHADTPSLEQVGKLVDQPMTGIAKVDATVTGNKRELQAQGTLVGNGIKYGDNGALTLSSDYSLKVPELNVNDLSVTANTHATFVSVGGQNINELSAKTDYGQKQVVFDATAKQPQRTLQAAGAVVLHPDHQEVHLKNVGLQTAGMTWQLAPGSTPTVRYGGNAVAIDELRLVNGDQQIAATGTFGRPDDALKVTLTNVDVASVDAVLLRPPQLSGRVSASTVIAGTKEAPAIKADFTITQGGFRQFHYDTFGGTVNYAGKTVTLDTTLQENATARIQAKGQVPVALFSGAAAHSTEPVDLQVDSSAIDLGLVQGFTTELTDVKGTLEAHVHVTGSASDPHPDGAIKVQNGAFAVPSTGVAYTDFQGQIDLQPDRVHIDTLRILDNHRSPLTVSGDLALREGEIGGVTIAIKADDFKIIDNKMGNVRVDSDLELAGELRAPRVEGELGVTTGVIDLDAILAKTSGSAYATEQTSYAVDNGEAYKPSPFDALQMDVHLTVPNDLVIKASDLQTPGSPVGLGALNLTLGGDLWASKKQFDQIRLVGAVNTVRGTYDFQGRRFDILRDGTVRFEGLDDLDPMLDIRTQRIIQGVTANVTVRGTMKMPEIELSSTPPLEQADILSLIVFNQPINELGEGQAVSLAQRAQALATGALAGQLAKSIGDALHLDTFEISTAPESGGAAQLTVGEQLGQNLYVKVQQSIGDQSQTNFILEYELNKWLRLQTNVLQGSSTQQQLFQRMQGSGVDLLFFFSY